MKMKKFLSIVLSVVLIMGMNVNVLAFDEENTTEYIPVLDKASAQATFRTGNLSSVQTRGLINSTSCSISNLTLTENNVSVILELGTDNKQVTLQGVLYDSYIQNEGYNAYVGNMTDISGEYEVLYFLIKDDTLEYKYILSEEYSSERAIVIYLQDENEEVYIIEQTLPQINGGNLADIDLELAPARMDYLWFTKILTPDEEGKLPNTVANNTREGRNGMEVTTIVFRDWTYGGDSFRESAWAKVEALIVDVGTSTSDANTKLSLVEYVYCNNSFYSNDSNYHLQAAGSQAVRDMYGKIAVGYNTAISEVSWGGKFWVWNNGSLSLAPSISIGIGVGRGIWSLGASLSLEISAPVSVQNESNGHGFYVENGIYPKTARYYIEKSKNIYLEDNGDYLEMCSDIYTINTDLAKNIETSAEIGWTFDIFYYDEFTPADSQTDFGPTVSYIVNAQ